MNSLDPDRQGRLAGKGALITGAAGGIGQAIAWLFAQEGAHLTLVDLDRRGRELAAGIEQAGGAARFVKADVSQPAGCELAVKAALANDRRVDILCNNAGIIRRASVVELSEKDWDEVMATNVKSIFLLSKLLVPYMVQWGGGAIVNTGSAWGLVGGARAAVYCASKGAVVLLTKAMAIDHGPQNIRVNCVCPGDTDTAMLVKEAEQLGRPPSDLRREAATRPLGRLGRPREIARAVLYLASDASSFVTGTSLVIDGGGWARG